MRVAGRHEEVPPYVEAQLPDGTWTRIADNIGFPPALSAPSSSTHTQAPSGARRIRLMTNLQLFWTRSSSTRVRMQKRTRPNSASTGDSPFSRYPKQIEGASPGDLDYEYNLVSLTGPTRPARKNYTRMGDVTPLLRASTTVLSSPAAGEEIAAEFRRHRAAASPRTWKRDYFFYANGFVKDMDCGTHRLYGCALPFHGMTSYPIREREVSRRWRTR